MSEQRRDMLPWYLAGGLAVVLVGGIALIVATQPGGGDGATADLKAVAAQPVADAPVAPPPGVPQRSSAERLSLAMAAIVRGSGTSSPMEEGATRAEVPKQLLDMPFGPVLLTEIAFGECSHACAGYLGIYYLTETPTGFDVRARHDEVISGGGWGEPPSWEIDNRFMPVPVIVSSTVYSTMGFSCGNTRLTTLTASGPKEIGNFASYYSNSGAVVDGQDMTGNPLTEHDSEVANIVRGQSFTVRYSGTQSFNELYRFANGVFTLQGGESQAGGC